MLKWHNINPFYNLIVAIYFLTILILTIYIMLLFTVNGIESDYALKVDNSTALYQLIYGSWQGVNRR